MPDALSPDAARLYERLASADVLIHKPDPTPVDPNALDELVDAGYLTVEPGGNVTVSVGRHLPHALMVRLAEEARQAGITPAQRAVEALATGLGVDLDDGRAEVLYGETISAAGGHDPDYGRDIDGVP